MPLELWESPPIAGLVSSSHIHVAPVGGGEGRDSRKGAQNSVKCSETDILVVGISEIDHRVASQRQRAPSSQSRVHGFPHPHECNTLLSVSWFFSGMLKVVGVRNLGNRLRCASGMPHWWSLTADASPPCFPRPAGTGFDPAAPGSGPGVPGAGRSRSRQQRRYQWRWRGRPRHERSNCPELQPGAYLVPGNGL